MKLRPILRVVRAPNRWVCSYCGSTIQPGETALKLGSVVFAVRMEEAAARRLKCNVTKQFCLLLMEPG